MKKPNILFIITDQQRIDTLGYRGMTPCKTPNTDWLAEHGVSFDNNITPSPLCGPARCSMFTGRYPHQVRGGHPGQVNMMTNDYTIGESPLFSNVMKENGYHLDYSGKWHLGNDVIDNWFDRAIGYDTKVYSEWCKENGIGDGWAFNDYSVRSHRPPHMSIPKPMVMDIDPQNHGDAWITDHAIQLIKSRPKNKPMYTVCSLNGPHPPFKVPEPYYSMYDPESIPEPENFNKMDGKPKSVKESYYHDLVMDFSDDWEDWKKSVAVYWGFVTMIDDQVGRLIECLEEEGILEETLIIFTSDHGEFMGQHGLWHKMQAYEEVLKVPLIISAPWFKQGLRCEIPSSLVDIVPTILTQIDAEIPTGMEGVDLTPILTGEQSSVDRSYVFSEHKPLGPFHKTVEWRMVMGKRYKYIWNNDEIDELYDLHEDPNELNNISGCEESASIECKMKTVLEEWMKETEDPIYPVFAKDKVQ